MASRSSYEWTLEHYGKAGQPDISPGVLVTVEWYPGQKDRLLPEHELLYRALGAVFLAYGYQVRDADTGFYNNRPITGGTRPSPHAWPIADDVNWRTNPYVNHRPTIRAIRWGVETDMPAAMVREAELITASGIQAFRWGGRWRTIKDAMHWEVRVTPEEIAGGVSSPRGFYGVDELAQLDEDAQRFFQGVYDELDKLEPHTSEECLRVLIEDFRQRKDAGQAGKHTHPIPAGVTGENE